MVWPRVKEGRKEGEDTTKKMITVPGKRRRGRPKKRWLDNINEDMKEYNMTEDVAENLCVWHLKSLLHEIG